MLQVFATQGGLDYILSLLVFILFIFFYNELQIWILTYSLKSFINEITVYEKLSRRLFLSLILANRKDLIDNIESEDPEVIARKIVLSEGFRRINRWIDEMINSFLIYPVTLDPTGILDRLEHLINIRRERFLKISSNILPDAPNYISKNLESALEAAAAIRYLWKISSHIYRVGKRTKNIYYLLQLRILMPFLRELCLSFFDAMRGFINGVPVGDSVGAMVAQRFFGSEVEVDDEDKIAYSSTEIDGRYILAVKAAGPGSEIGHPGRFLEKIIQKLNGDVDAIITVDAALRFESEEIGEVDVGVGAAIGDPGPEKFRIEKWTTKYRIPLFAVVIKENYIESLTPLRKELLDSIKRAYEIVKRLILEEVPEGGKAIILGIGNTIGVSNKPIKRVLEK